MSLKVVGAGHLGIRIGILWKKQFPDSVVFLKTQRNDPERNSKWKSLGFSPISAEEETDSNRVQTPFVVFCAPPSKNPNYAKDVETSVRNDWMKSDSSSGAFVFTSSGGVYAENSGGMIDENSEISSASERKKTLIAAEQKVLEYGGTVIRFGGLYTKTRGAHNYWLRTSGKETEMNEFSSCPNGLINLIHYDDAAKCVIKALLKSTNKSDNLFLVSDGVPISRENICKSALNCEVYKERTIPKFTGENDIVNGKKYNISLISKTLDWKPQYESFHDFMSFHCDKEMNIDAFL